MDDFQDILISGINFKRGGTSQPKNDDKVKTKAKIIDRMTAMVRRFITILL